MSHIRVKTEYEIEGPYGSIEVKTLYCHHNLSCDCVTFYNDRGEVESMAFCSWSSCRNDLWDAMQRLWSPFDADYEEELMHGVDYYIEIPIKT